MKKLIAVLLSLIFVLSLTACGSDSASSQVTDSTADGGSSAPSNNTNSATDTNSSDASSDSEEEPADGYQVPYSSVVKGYYTHTSKWNANVVNFAYFECMGDEYLLLPEGTTIICNEKFGVYCYDQEGDYLILDEKATTDLGQKFSINLDLSLQSGTYVLTKDTILRFVVKGELSDIKIYVPLELTDKVKLGTAEEFTGKE